MLINLLYSKSSKQSLMKYQHGVRMLLCIIKYFSASNHKIFILWLLATFFLAILYGGTSDYESMNLYLQKLQALSEHRLLKNQKSLVLNFYLHNQNRHPPKYLRHEIRNNFNKHKLYLKQKWSDKYKITWPNSLTVRNRITKTVALEAHHIIPINAGGINKWWNISPLKSANHKLLHNSIEEHACFSHNLFYQKCLRLVLKLKVLFNRFLSSPQPSLKIGTL